MPAPTIPAMNSEQRSALAVATMTAFLAPFMGSSVNIALPAIGRHFAMDAIILSWVPTAYLLAATVLLVPAGRFADIYGRKRVFTLGIALYTLASLLSSVSWSGSSLIVFRIVQGAGAAMIFGTGVAILTSVFPPGQRGKALGINVAGTYAGLSFGPFFGGVLTSHLGWRSIFLSNVPLGMVIIGMAVWKLKGEWAPAKGDPFDTTGSLVYGVGVAAFMYGLSLLPSWTGVWLILTGVLGLAGFVVRETHAPSPLLDIGLFRRNTVFALSNLAALINYSATFAVTFLLSLYLQYIKGLSAQYAGFLLVAQPVIMTLFSPLAGRLSDRVEPRIVASAGMTITALSLFLMILLNNQTGASFVVAILVVLGFGFALFSSPNTNAVMSSVEQRFYGVASSTVATMRLTGMMFSMGIAMLLFTLHMGRTSIAPEVFPLFLRSMRVAFLVFGILCVAGILASLARGSLNRSSAGSPPQ